jgi:ethanolamine utilization protein EutN
MLLGRVAGSVVSTVKDEHLTGFKLLLVQEADATGEPAGDPFVAVDSVGAGEGELVLVATGSAARRTASTLDRPVDAVIVGIVDSVEMDGDVSFRKS